MNSPAPIVAQLRYVSMVDQMGTVLDQSKIWFVKSQEAALCVDVCLSQMHPYVENVSCMLSDWHVDGFKPSQVFEDAQWTPNHRKINSAWLF